MERGLPELALTKRKATVEAAISRPYSIRACVERVHRWRFGLGLYTQTAQNFEYGTRSCSRSDRSPSERPSRREGPAGADAAA
ncbi:hypothetical protein EVAR_40773_1 [Eumeta japonica]|uniref:Uncharacterized protein n=1 Tax=Eumeta variegata TaxID=151549 RepID=A0A4C1X6Q0_EUMVA|nr:hypothetical protein EVAR_40773_1 [Eumeta japonica]